MLPGPAPPGRWELPGSRDHVTTRPAPSYTDAMTADPRYLQAALDALSAHRALVADDGTILAVNDAWVQFGRENGYDPPDGGVGTNYLRACDAGDADGLRVADGIRRVAAGLLPRFDLEYPCHTP